jgi:hypothetical protein
MNVRLLALLGCMLWASTAAAQDTQQVRAQLQAEYATLDAKMATLKRAETSMRAQYAQSQAQESRLRSEYDRLEADLARINDEKSRYMSAVSAHNARCSGNFTDASHVNQCNNKKADLDAWKNAYVNRATAHNQQKDAFNARRSAFYDQYRGVALRINDNLAEQRAAYSRMVVLREQISRLSLGDKFLIDPRNRERVSNECRAQKTDEQIVECMKRIFDGARAR